MILDLNDFPSFGKVPDAAGRVARTILRLAHRAQAANARFSPNTNSAIAMEASA